MEILTTGEAEVAGAAGIDLVHLLAELLDSAVAFSPPTAPIVVTGGADGDGFRVRLRRSPDGGVTVAVRLPAAQLSTRAPAPVRAS